MPTLTHFHMIPENNLTFDGYFVFVDTSDIGHPFSSLGNGISHLRISIGVDEPQIKIKRRLVMTKTVCRLEDKLIRKFLSFYPFFCNTFHVRIAHKYIVSVATSQMGFLVLLFFFGLLFSSYHLSLRLFFSFEK